MLGELMASSESYFNKKTYHHKRRILFPGTSSYPISPCKEAKSKADGDVTIEETDMMFKICERLNIDIDKDLSFLTDDDQIAYMNSLKS